MASGGAQSRGLHAVGRIGSALAEDEVAVLTTLCGSLGTVAHALDAGARQAGDARPSRILVEPENGVTCAEVTVPWGGRLLVGRGRAEAPLHAVAEAVVDALGVDESPVAALRGVGDESVAVVVVGEAVGAARCGADPLEAVAVATLRACDARTHE